MEKYIVLREFLYNGKTYIRGEEFSPEDIDMPYIKIYNRERARTIMPISKLSATEKAKLRKEYNAKKAPEVLESISAPEPVISNFVEEPVKQDVDMQQFYQKGNKRRK